jgi:hypothetical protein
MGLFSQSGEDKLIALMGLAVEHLQGIHVALNHMALKQQAIPLPEAPDDSDFLIQSDEDLGVIQALAASKTGPGADEVDLLDEFQKVQEEAPAMAPAPRVKPRDPFLARFQR